MENINKLTVAGKDGSYKLLAIDGLEVDGDIESDNESGFGLGNSRLGVYNMRLRVKVQGLDYNSKNREDLLATAEQLYCSVLRFRDEGVFLDNVGLRYITSLKLQSDNEWDEGDGAYSYLDLGMYADIEMI